MHLYPANYMQHDIVLKCQEERKSGGTECKKTLWRTGLGDFTALALLRPLAGEEGLAAPSAPPQKPTPRYRPFGPRLSCPLIPKLVPAPLGLGLAACVFLSAPA